MAFLRHVDFVLNGIAYLCYGLVSGRFWQKLFPISPREVFGTVGEALRFRLRHDDLTHYNAVQKALYLGVMLVGVLIVTSGLALWKPVQFSELASLFGSFQNHPARALFLHDRDRGVHRGSRDARSTGATQPRRHAHRRPNC